MYEGNSNVITAADIEEVRANGASAIALPDGRDALPVLLVLSPESGKVFGVGPGVSPMPAQLHLTNGIWHKLLDIAPLAAEPSAAESDNRQWMMTDNGPVPAEASASEAAAEPAAEPAADAEDSADSAE